MSVNESALTKEKGSKKVKVKKKLTINNLVKISMLGVMGYLLMFLEFALPIFPSFLKFDISDLPAIIGGFALGPVAGVLIQLVKSLLHFATASSTGGIGSFANFLMGAAFVFPAAFIYSKNKTFANAIIGLSIGTIIMVITAAFANYFILIPLYSELFIPLDVIIGMGNAIYSGIDSKFTLILYSIVPFNLLKGIGVSILTMLLYKKVSPLLRKRY